MKKTVLLTVVAALAVASLTMAAPDPWRIKVSDLDPTSPIYAEVRELVPESWGTNGGLIRMFVNQYNGDRTSDVWSYSAATGAISIISSDLIDIVGIGNSRPSNVVKVGSAYKGWHWWNNDYTGHDIQYTTSTDAINWTAVTDCTVYGSTAESTGSYNTLGVYRSTAGVYLRMHGNSMNAIQLAHGQGLATSGVGETEWYDIDTGEPDGNSTVGPVGDPIAEPHTIGVQYWENMNYARLARACDGNLFDTLGGWPSSPLKKRTFYAAVS